MKECARGYHKCKHHCEEHSGGVVLRRAPPDDVELLHEQQELFPGALAVWRVEGDGLAAIFWHRVLLDHVLISPTTVGNSYKMYELIIG